MPDIPQSIAKTQDELDAMTPAERKAYDEQQRLIVFGHDSRKDRHGNPVEQGIGCAGRETANHFQSIRRYEGEESYWNAVAELYKRDPKHHAKLGLPAPKQRNDPSYTAAIAEMWQTNPKMAQALGLPKPKQVAV